MTPKISKLCSIRLLHFTMKRQHVKKFDRLGCILNSELPEYQCIAKRHVSTDELIELFRNRPLQFEPGAEFGYSNSGWVLLEYILVVAHSGGLPGYVSHFVRLVEDNAVIILLSNLGNAAWSQLTEGLAAILLDQPYVTPSKQRFIEVEPATLAKYVGEYSVTFFGRTNTLIFTLKDGKLIMDVRGLPKTVCSALSPTTFYARSKGDVEMTFVRDADGPVRAIEMNWGGHQQMAQRIK